MNSYSLSRKASQDLDEIWDYSAINWNAAQANEYVNDIRLACTELCAGRWKGQNTSDLRIGYFRYIVRSHALYYRWSSETTIEIVRILHQRMDAEAHL